MATSLLNISPPVTNEFFSSTQNCYNFKNYYQIQIAKYLPQVIEPVDVIPPETDLRNIRKQTLHWRYLSEFTKRVRIRVLMGRGKEPRGLQQTEKHTYDSRTLKTLYIKRKGSFLYCQGRIVKAPVER